MREKMKEKKNYEIFHSLLEFIQSFLPYKDTKRLKDLSKADIEIFSAMYWLDRVPKRDKGVHNGVRMERS